MPTWPPGTPDIDLTVSGNFGDIGGAAFTTGPARDLPVPTPTIWPTISMQAPIVGSRLPTAWRTAAGKATTAS